MSHQSLPHATAAASTAPAPDGRSRVLRWAVASALLGAFMVYNSLESSGSTPLPAPAPAAVAPAPLVPSTAAAAAPPSSSPTPGYVGLAASQPTRLTIRTIGVDAPFVPLTLDKTGKLNAPPAGDTNLVGWYADGPTPGELGAAIVAGHVDTKTGPAVFLLLRLLKPGSTAEITRADGTVASFTVDSVEQFSKDDFPDQRVYGDTPDAQLRIITCGGSYDHSKHDYTANVVVFAHLTGSRRA